MADEVVEKHEIALDDPNITQEEYVKRRTEAKTVPEEPEKKEEPEEKEEPSEEQEPEEPQEPEKPKARGGFQRRIDKLAKEAAQERERRQAAERRLQDYESKSKSAEAPAKPAGRPDPNDFKTYEEYIEALTDYKVAEKLRTQKEQEEAAAEKATAEANYSDYESRLDEARGKYEDFDDVFELQTPWPQANATRTQMAAAESFRIALIEDENSGEILNFFRQNPDQLAEFGDMSPAQVVKAIGRLSLALEPEEAAEKEEKEEKPAPKIVSKAAPPIKPVGSSGSGRNNTPLDEMDMASYVKARAAGRVR